MNARIVSVNVGRPQDVQWNGDEIITGIFKKSISGQVKLHRLGLDGDTQVDLTVHGGPDKAVYAYPSEHYEYWKGILQNKYLPWGYFGENLTTQHILEKSVHVGDRFRIGSTELVVTQPRFPCYKLGVRVGDMTMVRKFQASGRSGFYMAVSKEGVVEEGDAIELLDQHEENPTIAQVFMRQNEAG